MRGVAPVRLGAVPRKRVLLGLRARKEGGRLGEDARDGRGGDAVVLEVQEAGLLEPAEDGLGCGALGGGGAVEEVIEVDELGMGERECLRRAGVGILNGGVPG